MRDLFRLIGWTVVDLFRSRAALEAEIWTLRQQINVLRRTAAIHSAVGCDVTPNHRICRRPCPMISRPYSKRAGAPIRSCACRKSNPDVLVVQSTQDRTAKNVSSTLNGARCRRIYGATDRSEILRSDSHVEGTLRKQTS